MKVLIAHEAPTSIIWNVSRKTDIDYCLVHLMYESPDYRKYFENARKVYNREVILDCSIFELGKAFDETKYIQQIKNINPNSYIVPDVLEDANATVNNFQRFIKENPVLNEYDGKKIGVIQGKSWTNIEYCYRFMAEHADIIAISFDMHYFENINAKTWEENMMRGRQQLIKTLIDKGVWDWNKPHHLLGCTRAAEFSYYRNNNIYNIRSLDTNNPVIHGIKGIKYNSTFGLDKKDKTKIADLVSLHVYDDQWEIIDYNIDQFKKIVNG